MKEKIEDDLYTILGVDKNATQEEIKKAYREKAVHLHPDKGGNAEDFSKLGAAYEILSDSEKRKEYDEFGTTSDTSDILKAAIAHVQSLMVEAIKNNCGTDNNMVFFGRNHNVGIAKHIKDSIKHQIAATRQSITNVESVIEKLEAQKPKVRIKKNAKRKIDVFASVIDGLIDNSKSMKAKAECQLEMLQLAAEIAADYEDVPVGTDNINHKAIDVDLK